MKIGLLMIATGKYDRFVQPLLDSAKKYFLVNEQVNYFLFTDSKKFISNENLHVFEKKHEPFPSPTLKRYETFVDHSMFLNGMDYLFYCDVDMLFVDEIGNEILSDRTATIHPGFMGGRGTPETRKESLAYVDPKEKLVYYAGGFNGGTTKEFLKMSEILDKNIKKDLSKNIIAIWHDESHMNRYFIDNPPIKILTPSYCYPESSNIPLKKKLLALDKNHNEVRN